MSHHRSSSFALEFSGPGNYDVENWTFTRFILDQLLTDPDCFGISLAQDAEEGELKLH